MNRPKQEILEEKQKELQKRKSEPNISHLRKFIEEKQDLDPSTRLMYVRFILPLNEWVNGKDIKDFNEEDLVKINRKIHNKKDWGWSNRDTFISKFRAFSRWVLDLDSQDKLPNCYKKLVRPNAKNKPQRCTPENTLTDTDVFKMIEACSHPRNRWIIAGLYDTSFRPSEFLSITNKNIKIDTDGKYLVFCPKSKTYSRWCKLTYSDSYLKEWLANHPFKTKTNFPLVPQLDGPNNESISIESLNAVVKKIGKEALNRTDLTSYHLRHAGLTEAGKHLKGEMLNRYAGWKPGSKMSGVYQHYSDTDVNEIRAKAVNVDGSYEPPKPEVNKIVEKEKVCLSCKARNTSESIFCIRCGVPLEVKARIEAQNKENILIDLLDSVLKSKTLTQEQAQELMKPILRKKLQYNLIKQD